MIYINPEQIEFPEGWQKKAQELTDELLKLDPNKRDDFIEKSREESWADEKFLTALRKIAGNKCWYSEVILNGADPNIDHFRPKGRVREVDNNSLIATGGKSPGYWWLAFEPKNFRLACMHANQRRVDEKTEGGKWNYFPVQGNRAPEKTKLRSIRETVLPLDPCSAIDMALLWFDPDGVPSIRKTDPSDYERQRIKVTVWLYHLDKKETAKARATSMEKLRTDLINADAFYNMWQDAGGNPTSNERFLFDGMLSKINSKIADNAAFAGAKRCVIQLARAEYPWLDEYMPVKY